MFSFSIWAGSGEVMPLQSHDSSIPNHEREAVECLLGSVFRI